MNPKNTLKVYPKHTLKIHLKYPQNSSKVSSVFTSLYFTEFSNAGTSDLLFSLHNVRHTNLEAITRNMRISYKNLDNFIVKMVFWDNMVTFGLLCSF